MLTGSSSVAMEAAAVCDGGRVDFSVVTSGTRSLAGRSEDADVILLEGTGLI